MTYNGKWIDSFSCKVIKDSPKKNMNGRIILKTPSIDYCFSREDWELLKEKINKV